jgi:hypothetical protein
MEGRTCEDTGIRVAIYKPGREALEETSRIDAFIIDFWSQDGETVNLFCVNLLVWGTSFLHHG